MFRSLRRLKTFLLDLLFPLTCLNCQQEGTLLCEKCFESIKINDRLQNDLLSEKLIIPNLNRIYLAGNYDNKLLGEIIKKYKYEFLSALSEPLGRFLISFWEKINGPSDFLENIIVMPLPLTRRRYKWRGFNQAELLARAFSTHFNYPLNTNLERIKNQPPQVGLDEKERIKNVSGIFRLPKNSLLDKNVLLIDDIVTTGATLNEAALTLKAAGAKSVSALVLAKG